MNLIAAVDQNWAIGNKNQLLVKIPADQKFFRETTTGKVVVMGRKTLESFPNAQPLPNRVNIVMTKNPNYRAKGCVIVHSEEELMEELKNYPDKQIFLIGGASIYEQLLPRCEEAYVTRIDYSYQADCHFPDLDASDEWELYEEGEEQTFFSIEYYFNKYRKK